MNQTPAAAQRRRFSKHDFYRYCRIVHGWLSAFAFLMLCFFAFTGLLLNHPDWSMGAAPEQQETQFTLTAAELDSIRNDVEPAERLADIAATKVAVKGAFTGGNKVGDEVFVRMQGVRGLTDLRASLSTGNVAVVIEPVRAMSVLNELHRGERAGKTWRLLIDVFAIVLLALSIIGYFIFLSMRARLRTALIITVASTVALWGIFMLAVV